MLREHEEHEMPKRLRIFLSLVSAILSGGALWYAWLRYSGTLDQPAPFWWYDRVQPGFIALAGILYLLATILFLLSSSAGWSVLKAGLSIIPLLLFSNLMVFIVRIVQSVLQGNASFFFERVIAQPHKFILIPIIVIALMLLGALGKYESNR
jgi:hypothetical protein